VSQLATACSDGGAHAGEVEEKISCCEKSDKRAVFLTAIMIQKHICKKAIRVLANSNTAV
jgi:hypothetical protein